MSVFVRLFISLFLSVDSCSFLSATFSVFKVLLEEFKVIVDWLLFGFSFLAHFVEAALHPAHHSTIDSSA